MPLPEAPGHARIYLKGQWSNTRPVVNVLDMRRETGGGSWTTIVRDVMDNWQDEILDLLMNNYQFTGAHYIELETGGEVGDLAPDPAKHTSGQRAGEAAPPNTALLVHKQSARHRGVRTGRWYLAGIDEAGTDENGGVSGSLLADWATTLAAFWSGVDDADRHPSVVHFDGSADDITGFSADPIVASMRRRVRK